MVDDRGLPLGIIAAQCDADSIDGRHGENRANTPIEQKESYKWLAHYKKILEADGYCPETKIISVMDREADLFELHEIAYANKKKVPVVIRAQHNRRLANSSLKLFEFMKESLDQTIAQ